MDTFWGLSSIAWTATYTLLTAGLLMVAVAAALYARAQWRANREQVEDARRAQLEASRPYVIVAAESTAAARNLFDLSVRNIGKRPALNVTLRFDPAPTTATPTPGYEMDKLRMLKEPIAMIAPDQDMRAFWDSHAERHGRNDLPQSHRVSVSYSDSSGNTYNEESVIDLAAMEGATYVESKSIHDIGKTLDKMAKTLHEAPILSRNGKAEVLAITETREARDDRQVRLDYERLVAALKSARAWDRSDPKQVAALEAKVARLEETHPRLKEQSPLPASTGDRKRGARPHAMWSTLRLKLARRLQALTRSPRPSEADDGHSR